jgi:tungstate transport system substrate-binding protein
LLVLALLFGLVGEVAGGEAAGAERFIVVASTTSTQNSGLFAHLLPRFRAKTGIEVRVVAVGTGAALRLARNGDADVLIVHHRASEEAFVAAGHGLARHQLMHNDFLVVGPRADPAGIAGEADVAVALARIAGRGALFVSRGDDSGTHSRELALWVASGVDPGPASGRWYRETGSGMGATLNIAAAMAAYTLVDRATWLSFRNTRGLTALVEGDPRLRNDYGIILVDPARHPHVKAALGQVFIDWLLSAEGRALIESFQIAGQRLFHVE